MKNIFLFLLLFWCLFPQGLLAQPSSDPAFALYYTQIKAAEAYLRLNQIGEARQILKETQPELRGWEWELLTARTDRSTKTLLGHRSSVVGIALSPDGKYLASGSADSTIHIWDTENGRLLTSLTGHKGQVSSLDFSPDGKSLVSGATDKTVKLWDLQTFKEKNSFASVFTQGVYQVKFSPDGALLGVVSWERTGQSPPVIGFVKILEAATGAVIRRIDLDPHPASALDFSPDGQKLMTGTWGMFVNYHDLNTGQLEWNLDLNEVGYYAAIQSADISPDGRQVLEGGKDSRIRLLDASNGKILFQIEPHQGHKQWVNALRFSPDGKRFASGSDDGLVMVWNTSDARLLFTFRGHEGGINGLVWHPNGDRLYSSSTDKTIREWSIAEPGELSFDVCEYGPWYAPLSKDGKYLAAACSDRQIGVWNIQTGTQEYLFEGPNANCAVFSRDGKYLASGGHDQKVRLFDLAGRRQIFELEGHTNSIYGIAFHEGKRLLASAGDQTIRLWDAQNGTFLRSLELSGEGAYAVQFSPDEKLLVVGTTKGSILLIDTDTWQVMHTFKINSPVNYLDIHASGKYLISVGSGGATYFFDLEKKTMLRQFQAHTKTVYGAAFHPTRPYAVTVSYDRTARFWDVEKGICTLTWYGFDQELFTTAISAGKLIISETEGVIRVYDIGNLSNK